ncbi:MAG TPA: hypothetical protein VIN07_01835 [Flavipsychrobacter sp.]
MKKLFIHHIRFMAMPAIVTVVVRIVDSYANGKLDISGVAEILFSAVLLVIILFPVYLVLRAVWRKIFVQKAENQ